MIETRPRSSAAAWRTTPTIWAASPSSQTHWPRSTRKLVGCRKETPLRLSAAFCQSVAASAKQTAARSARRAATSSTGANYRFAVHPGEVRGAGCRAASGAQESRVTSLGPGESTLVAGRRVEAEPDVQRAIVVQ